MLSNFHRTTSECWQRTPGTQKGSLFSSKGGRTKYKRPKKKKERETKEELGMETRPGEGVMEKFPKSRKPLTGRSVRSFGISEGNITRRKKNPQNMRLTPTPSRDVAQMLVTATSKQGLDREARVPCLGKGPGLNTPRTI